MVKQLQYLQHERDKYILDFNAAVDSILKDYQDFQVIINSNKRLSGGHQGCFNTLTTREIAVIVGQVFEKKRYCFKQ